MTTKNFFQTSTNARYRILATPTRTAPTLKVLSLALVMTVGWATAPIAVVSTRIIKIYLFKTLMFS